MMEEFPVGEVAEFGTGDGPNIRMLDCEGRDQIVRACLQRGWKSFESPMPCIFHQCARRFPGVVADIGANTGFYAILAAMAREDARVIAFEPDPHVRAILEENVRLNGIGHRVEVSPLALSNRAGHAPLFIPERDHGYVETSSSLEKSFKSSHAAVTPVRIETLDQVAARSGQERFCIVKIDVEGHEAAVLEGASATLNRDRPLLFVEILPHADFAFLDAFVRYHAYTDFPLSEHATAKPTERIEFHEHAWNHLLVPKETVGGITACLTTFK